MTTDATTSRAAVSEPAEGRDGHGAPRPWRGAAVAILVPPILAVALDLLRHELNLTSTALLFLLGVVAVARLGGIVSAVCSALWACFLLNYYFVPPLHSAAIANGNDVIALVVFVVVALTVASVVDLARRESRSAARANAEAATLNALSVAVLRGDGALDALLSQLCKAFRASAASLLQRREPRSDDDPTAPTWQAIAVAGPLPPDDPARADTVVPLTPDAVMALRGRVLAAQDKHVLSAFTAQATAALERKRLAESAAETASLQAADKMRNALLAAVSHDLRGPLSAAYAAVGTLADRELALAARDRVELVEILEESLARLMRMLEDLLDMSRLQGGVLKPHLVAFDVLDVLGPALAGLSDAGDRSRVRIEPPDPGLPQILGDAPLVERVVANLVANAIKYTDTAVNVAVEQVEQGIRIRVADHGPGIPSTARDLVFLPFQRLGDRPGAPGVGLGLALARGLTESMGGTLTPEDTVGGGLTMSVTLPAALEPDTRRLAAAWLADA